MEKLFGPDDIVDIVTYYGGFDQVVPHKRVM